MEGKNNTKINRFTEAYKAYVNMAKKGKKTEAFFSPFK